MDLFHQRVEQSQVSPVDDGYESAGYLGMDSGDVIVTLDHDEEDDPEKENWGIEFNEEDDLEFNLDDAESNMELYIDQQDDDDEDYLHTTEYEMLFEAEISSGLGKPPASKSFIKNLKVSPLTKEGVTEKDDDGDAMCCAVCRDEMNVGSEVAELPCRHRYHSDCIVPWLGIRNTCPKKKDDDDFVCD
ncbi:E3 ubiquitin-protein ligase Praja-2 [Raphanus sativus]|nr:E3 ubiquitin-protein ligase Praja-2 [Raphanus sativus]